MQNPSVPIPPQSPTPGPASDSSHYVFSEASLVSSGSLATSSIQSEPEFTGSTVKSSSSSGWPHKKEVQIYRPMVLTQTVELINICSTLKQWSPRVSVRWWFTKTCGHHLLSTLLGITTSEERCNVGTAFHVRTQPEAPQSFWGEGGEEEKQEKGAEFFSDETKKVVYIM